jgi:hypothetical protein
MKLVNTLAVAAGAVAVASAAHAGSLQFEGVNITPVPAAVHQDQFKMVWTDTLAGPVGYSIEGNATDYDNTKFVKSAQLLEKLYVTVPLGFLTSTSRVMYGENFYTTKYNTIWGLEEKITSKTPIQNLTVSTGYRYLEGTSVAGEMRKRIEASSDYALTKKYSVGVVYYNTTGDSKNNQLGGYLKIKF